VRISPLLRKDIYILALMILIVPLAGELKFFPFDGTFRVSLGSPAFFFFLLLLRKLPAIAAGFLIGLSVEGFRFLVDLAFIGDANWSSFFQVHYPAFFYYLAFGALFDLFKVNRFHNRPFLLGLLGIMIEITANVIELAAQMITLNTFIPLSDMNKITIISIFRSFFVIGFLNLMKLYEARVSEMKIRKQNERMLMLISNLYEESIFLKKTLVNAENITKKTYDLYKGLNQVPSVQEVTHLRQQALTIAGEVHDIKKDNQRIFAGLSKLITEENYTPYMNVDELVSIIIRSNKKYALLLKKDVQFTYKINGNHPDYHVYTILSIINNIVANAVEALADEGMIEIRMAQELDFIEFRIEDNGPGIPPKHRELIFKPGFTSKYDRYGNPSTGIGLFYVKEMIEQLGGDVTFENRKEGSGTLFIIRLPILPLIEKG
jgi:two-component system, sensor histidine kinase YcbA